MGLFDKLMGKTKREEARLAAEIEELAQLEKERLAEERKLKRLAKKEAKAAKEAEQAKVAEQARIAEQAKNSEKELATKNGEPYVAILKVELDPENIGNGAFELDWNDKFVTNLVRAGYQAHADEADSVIVDRWFQSICRNILAENYEQWEANYTSGRRIDTEDLGDGKSSIS